MQPMGGPLQPMGGMQPPGTAMRGMAPPGTAGMMPPGTGACHAERPSRATANWAHVSIAALCPLAVLCVSRSASAPRNGGG